MIANRMESKSPKETREAGERVGGGLGCGHVQDREVDDADVLDVRGGPLSCLQNWQEAVILTCATISVSLALCGGWAGA